MKSAMGRLCVIVGLLSAAFLFSLGIYKESKRAPIQHRYEVGDEVIFLGRPAVVTRRDPHLYRYSIDYVDNEGEIHYHNDVRERNLTPKNEQSIQSRAERPLIP